MHVKIPLKRPTGLLKIITISILCTSIIERTIQFSNHVAATAFTLYPNDPSRRRKGLDVGITIILRREVLGDRSGVRECVAATAAARN